MDPRPRTPLLAAAPAPPSAVPTGSLVTTGSRSGADESADQGDHAVNVVIGERGEQRKRDLLRVELLGHGAHARTVAKVRVDGMPVDGQVVDLNADVVGPEVLEQ